MGHDGRPTDHDNRDAVHDAARKAYEQALDEFRPIPGVAVIGITGQARHGKDTLALDLMDSLMGAERYALSDAISVVARIFHGMTLRDPRQQQEVGLRYRQITPRVWLETLYGTIWDKRPEIAIITGVRYHNEADMIHRMGGPLIMVRRVTASGALYVTGDRDTQAPTEISIDQLPADYVVTVGEGEQHTLAPRVRTWLTTQRWPAHGGGSPA